MTIVAPLTTWTFTFLAGTGHIVYPLLPVIYETAHQNGIRPERPMAVATIASQQAITASPVAAGEGRGATTGSSPPASPCSRRRPTLQYSARAGSLQPGEAA